MEKSQTNLCIKHLPTDFEKQDLVSLCYQFGMIRSAKIMFDLKTGRSKGFGFVRFESPFSAALALEKLNGTWVSKKKYNPLNHKEEINSNKIFVSYAVSDENTGNSSNKIIVSSLPLFYVKKDIYDLFSKYGKIESIEMLNDAMRNRYHGKAIITYKTNKEAEEALKNLNNIKLSDDSWPLFIQFIHNPKQESIRKSNDVTIEDLTRESNAFLNSGIRIQRPIKNKPSFVSKENQVKKNIEDDDDEYYRNEQFKTLMFKIIAEEY